MLLAASCARVVRGGLAVRVPKGTLHALTSRAANKATQAGTAQSPHPYHEAKQRSCLDSEEIEVLREVASAINALTSMDPNKMEICDRAISTIIAMLLSGDTEVERHSTCAVANLMENVRCMLL